MKYSNLNIIFPVLFAISFLTSSVSFATTHSIQVADFSFTPANQNAVVGDTIRWVWVSGDHTTTCDGSIGTSLPGGAAPWNSNINAASTTFSYVLTVEGTYNYKCIPHFPSMVGTLNVSPTSITQTSSTVPDKFSLGQNYPNPFNPATKIRFDIAKSGKVSLKIYDMAGQEVAKLVSGILSAGSYEATWSAENISGGVYFYKLESGDFIQTKKMILIK